MLRLEHETSIFYTIHLNFLYYCTKQKVICKYSTYLAFDTQFETRNFWITESIELPQQIQRGFGVESSKINPKNKIF